MDAPALKRLQVRAAREEDLAAALPLVEFEREKNPWIGITSALLSDAVGQPDGEHRACIAERDGEMVGFAAYGVVAGALGTGVLFSIFVAPRSRRAGIGHRLLTHVVSELARGGCRVIFAEVPGDPGLVRYRAMLISYGFLEEARIEDYYRDAVPQIISRLNL